MVHLWVFKFMGRQDFFYGVQIVVMEKYSVSIGAYFETGFVDVSLHKT